MSPMEQYLERCRELVAAVEDQREQPSSAWQIDLRKLFLPAEWYMCLAVVTAGSWSRRCGRAMDHSQVLIRS